MTSDPAELPPNKQTNKQTTESILRLGTAAPLSESGREDPPGHGVFLDSVSFWEIATPGWSSVSGTSVLNDRDRVSPQTRLVSARHLSWT